ncbi:metal-dependent phosphohydrolase, partial [Clostridium saudiense]|nr:metal-dependent phosphohydrolase [Clostridium saudiense]
MIVPAEEIYNVAKEEIYTTEVTKEVLENFKRKDTILK